MKMSQDHKVEKDIIFEKLYEREKLGTTGLEKVLQYHMRAYQIQQNRK